MEQTIIYDKIKTILNQVLQLNVANEQISVEQPFFSSAPDNPGLIEDSLAILEISSRLAEEFDLTPGEIDEKSFLNIRTLGDAIHAKIAA